MGVKLPVIRLPEFDGSPERWIKFRDKFQSMIDDNRTLTKIQKFYYLESANTGELCMNYRSSFQRQIIHYMTSTTLKERFEDQKALSHYHVRGLFELSVMAKDSSLRQLINQVKLSSSVEESR